MLPELFSGRNFRCARSRSTSYFLIRLCSGCYIMRRFSKREKFPCCIFLIFFSKLSRRVFPSIYKYFHFSFTEKSKVSCLQLDNVGFLIIRSWKYDARRFWIFERQQLLFRENYSINLNTCRVDRLRNDELDGIQ